ncbi:unnamed protein product [marine sediment metagenome]|uniref:Uncharacterized protein n=1 Tax=marine sediment metagenome TaxID=412755 RepID=X1P3I9_9ZZZZ
MKPTKPTTWSYQLTKKFFSPSEPDFTESRIRRASAKGLWADWLRWKSECGKNSLKAIRVLDSEGKELITLEGKMDLTRDIRELIDGYATDTSIIPLTDS